MKKQLLCLLASFILLAGVEAQVSNPYKPKPKPIVVNNPTTLSVSQTEAAFDATGGTVRISVSTNASSWIYLSKSSWCSVSKSGSYLFLTCEPNNDVYRSAVVYVRAGNKSAQISVYQESNADYADSVAVAVDTIAAVEDYDFGTSDLEKGDWRHLISNVMRKVTVTGSSSKYKGQMVEPDNICQGLGVLLFNNDDSYWGKFYNNKKNGEGIYIVGDPDARDMLNCLDCDYFVGSYSANDKSGKGTCYDKTGKLIYYGDFAENKPIETYPKPFSDNIYKFECINYESGNVYVGETKDGKRHGLGIYFWSDGDAWYGNFKDGVRNGEGIYLYDDGSVNAGRWNGDEYLGK